MKFSAVQTSILALALFAIAGVSAEEEDRVLRNRFGHIGHNRHDRDHGHDGHQPTPTPPVAATSGKGGKKGGKSKGKRN